MLYEFSRTEMIIGEEGIKKLKNSKVAIFGIGGVGSFVVEALVRSGVGEFVLIDDDAICITNLNRQLHATMKTVGQSKVECMKDRILEINPKARVDINQSFYTSENAYTLLSKDYDYVVDAIDTVTSKLDLVVRTNEMNIPIISCMGTGNKLDPTKFEVADIYKTSVCPLAKIMRKELRKRGINSLKVVYSKEEPIKPMGEENSSCKEECVCPKGSIRKCSTRRQIPGSISFLPSVAGIIIAGEVVKDLIK